MGLSHLYNQDYQAAIGYLEQVPIVNEETAYEQESRWFLALAFLKNDNVTEGKAVLQAIAQGDWQYDKAQELLAAIK